MKSTLDPFKRAHPPGLALFDDHLEEFLDQVVDYKAYLQETAEEAAQQGLKLSSLSGLSGMVGILEQMRGVLLAMRRELTCPEEEEGPESLSLFVEPDREEDPGDSVLRRVHGLALQLNSLSAQRKELLASLKKDLKVFRTRTDE